MTKSPCVSHKGKMKIIAMRSGFLICGTIFLCAFLAGCLTSSVSQTGGRDAVTVPNTTIPAIVAAAQTSFAAHGYSPGPQGLPNFITFDRPAGAFGEIMFGSYGRTTTFRVRLQLIRLPGTTDIRLVPSVSRVGSARMAGFENETRMLRFWSGQFRPILRSIKAEAANTAN